MMQLAAPHTWAASIMPVLVATCMAVVWLASQNAALDPIMVCVLLAIAVAMQSAVNTINDYFDYVKGTDTVENQDDPTDAVLVYNNVDPVSARNFACALIVCAFLLGIYCVVRAGWVPLVIAAIGVVVIVLYSGGHTPISYLPLGEVVSGFTMGGLITLASYCCLTRSFSLSVLVYAIPQIVGIALIMLTNNGCDIEKDTKAQRKTLPVLIGYEKTCSLYHALVYLWVVSVCVLVLVQFTRGWPLLPFMLLAIHPIGRALLANPLLPQTRAAAFSQCTSLNIAIGAFYAAAILASGVI